MVMASESVIEVARHCQGSSGSLVWDLKEEGEEEEEREVTPP